MKHSVSMAVATLLLAASTFAQGQSMLGSMPSMNMPAEPKAQPAQNNVTPKKKAPTKSDQSMQGMDMSTHGDMQCMPMDAATQNGYVTPDISNVQEPENPSRTTGGKVPAPDLLKGVAARPSMALKDFLDQADKTNPTLAQANAFVRRSTAQAQQAGLYPNPSVGYQGEQIRGGTYGGGEQGAYMQQTIVLGGKLGLRRGVYLQQKQSDQIGVEEQIYRVHNDVTQAYYTA